MTLLQIFTMIDCYDLNNAFFHFSLANGELTLGTVNDIQLALTKMYTNDTGDLQLFTYSHNNFSLWLFGIYMCEHKHPN